MTKQEFLEQFEDALVGELSNAAIYDHKQYYERYMNNEIRKGRTESEVLEELGNPRLIAKTLVEMQSPGNNGAYEEYETHGKSRTEDKKRTHSVDNVFQKLDMTTWAGRLITGAAGILCLIVVISLISGILSVAFRLAGPVLLIFLVIYVFRKLFEK